MLTDTENFSSKYNVLEICASEYAYIIHLEIFHGNKSDDAWRENHNELCLHRLDMNLTWA